MAQFWRFVFEQVEHFLCAVTVLNIGSMDPEREQIPAGVGLDVALMTLDPFAHCPAGFCEARSREGRHSCEFRRFQWFSRSGAYFG